MARYLPSSVQNNTPYTPARPSRSTGVSIKTLAAYQKRIRMYKRWCSTKYPNIPEDQRYIVTGEKLEAYLIEAVVERNASFNIRHIMPRKIHYKSVVTHVDSMMYLYRQQQAAGENDHPNPRDHIKPLLRRIHDRDRRLNQLEEDIRRERSGAQTEVRASADRRGLVSERRVGNDATKRLVLHLCQDDQPSGEQLRNTLSLVLYQHFPLCGDSIRHSFLGDLQYVEIEDSGSHYPVLGFFIKQDSSADHAQIGFIGCMRSKEPLVCPFAAMGLYMFWRFHMTDEPFPDLSCTQLMRMIRLLRTSALSALSCKRPVIEKIFATAMLATDISLTGFGHLYRDSGPEIADVSTIPENEFRRVDGAFLAQQNIGEMREAAGFSGSDDYFIPRSQVAPPPELCSMVFPDVNSGPPNVCQSAGGFLRLVRTLKRTFLQDAAMIQDEIPDHPIWQHHIFKSHLYLDFKRRVQDAPARRPAADNRMYDLAEGLANDVRQLQEQFSQQFQRQRHELEALGSSVVSGLKKLDAIQQRSPRPNPPSATEIQAMLRIQSILANTRSRTTLEVDTLTSVDTPLAPSPATAALSPATAAPSPATAALSPATAPEPSPAPTPTTQASSRARSDTPVPQHSLIRGLNTVLDIYKEYKEGLDGGPALEHLEYLYGTGWRKNLTDTWYFNKRLGIIKLIRSVARRKGVTEQEGAELLENWRVSGQRSIWWLYNNLNSLKSIRIDLA